MLNFANYGLGPSVKLFLIIVVGWQLGLSYFTPAGKSPTSSLNNSSNLPSKPADERIKVLTHHNDQNRTGANLKETILNTANVNVRQFGKIFSRPVEGQIYAQPLYVSQIEIPRIGPRNVVYVATERNNVYAFDADDPAATTPYWKVSLGAPVPSVDISEFYRDLTPEIGITSTPVIDLESRTIYVVAKSKDVATKTYYQKLHALDLTTGLEKPGSPATITASVAGTGTGSVDGVVRFDPLLNLNRPGLLLLNGVVYLAFGSHGGERPYHGWVMGYDAATLKQVAVFNTTPDGGEGGIWQSGQGLAADVDGFIYIVTGNGTFNAQSGGRNYGDSAIKLGTKNGLTVADYYTPFNEADLNEIDADLGSGGPVLLPGVNRMIFTGKDTVFRVLDAGNLGKFDPQIDQIVQRFQPSTRRMLGSPVYWESPNYGPVIYYWASGDNLKVFQLVNGRFQEFTAMESAVTSFAGISNAPPMSLSANGSKAGTGIVWATASIQGDPNQMTAPGIVRAFDATDVSRELWNSRQNPDRDGVGSFAKFCPPTVANGKVYLATFSGQLHVYGLLPGVCNYSLASDNKLATSGSEEGSVELKVNGECGWMVSSSEDWIKITSNNEGTGNGTITYSIDPNPSSAMRSGTILVAGQTYTIKQAGSAGVVSAASFDGIRLAPEAISSIFGGNFASATELAGSSLPTKLAGTSVIVTDSTGVERLSPLFFVSPWQINYQIPPGTAYGNAMISIKSADGNLATGVSVIEKVAPGLFSANSNGEGVAAALVLRVKDDNSQTYEPVIRFDAAQNRFIPLPIDFNSNAGPNTGPKTGVDQVYLVLFGTGIRFFSGLENIKASIGGIEAPVMFAGAQTDWTGLDQINLFLPRSLAGRGEMDVNLTVDGLPANTVRISVK